MDTKSESDVGAAAPLPTQLEVAESKSGPRDTTPTTTTTLKRIRQGLRPAHGEPVAELHEGKMVPFTATTVVAISWACADPVCTDDERVKLRAIQTKMDAVLAETDKWSLSKVEAFIHKQRDAIHNQALSGEQL